MLLAPDFHNLEAEWLSEVHLLSSHLPCFGVLYKIVFFSELGFIFYEKLMTQRNEPSC